MLLNFSFSYLQVKSNLNALINTSYKMALISSVASLADNTSLVP